MLIKAITAPPTKAPPITRLMSPLAAKNVANGMFNPDKLTTYVSKIGIPIAAKAKNIIVLISV